MVVAFVLTVAFVLWAGIRGVASTSYLKDALMLVVLHRAGGVDPRALRRRDRADCSSASSPTHPGLLTVHAGHYDAAGSSPAGGLDARGAVHDPAALLAGAALGRLAERALRRNYVFLPIYSVCLVLPMIIGFVAVTGAAGEHEQQRRAARSR